MSEYQYYEFRAIDRVLSPREIEEIRSLSSRAKVTETGFVNEYHYGDFRGDPQDLMARYFDAFLYFANWGTRTLMFKLPASEGLALAAIKYKGCETVSVSKHGNSIVVSFHLHNDEWSGWYEGDEFELQTLLPVRAAIMHGDYRVFYLAWLAAAQAGELDGVALEPEVPSGLRELDGGHAAIVDFFEIDEDLLAAAAEQSPDLPSRKEKRTAVSQWVEKLTPEKRDEYLLGLLMGDEGYRPEQIIVHALEKNGRPNRRAKRRTVDFLVMCAEELGQARQEEGERVAAQERAEREAEVKRQREEYLRSMAGKEPALWKQAEQLAEMKIASAYEQAVRLMIDLRDLADRHGDREFGRQLDEFRMRHAKKYKFLERLDKAGLAGGVRS